MAYKPSYIFILFAVIIIDYTAALFIEKYENPKTKKVLLLISLISNIGILAYFKYFNFLLENMANLFSGSFKPIEILLPVGLSFHTFQSMAYTIEVARGNQKAERHLGYFASYVLFFPQMVAGPIEKYSSLGVQLRSRIEYHYENFSHGFRLMLYGLFVKVVVADSISWIPDVIFLNPEQYSSYDTWIGIFAFSVQIYADFFGYSTIAVGAARCLGINLMDNFRNPYFSISIPEFWKRWHISLTSWFREYVYFPMGGNKVKKWRWVLNILLVFGLSGLWHGASWNFVWWGLAHGILYLAEKPLDKINFSGKIIAIPMILVNFIIISIVWVFFRASDMKITKQIFLNLFSGKPGITLLEIPWEIPSIIVLFLFSEIIFRKSRIDKFLDNKNVFLRWGVYAALFFFIFLWSDINTKPFIYFKF
jgi:alginate O-acetyltransferase complex protein AlgI